MTSGPVDSASDGLAVLGSVATGVGVWASTAAPVPVPVPVPIPLTAAQIDNRLEDAKRGIPAGVVQRRDAVLAELATCAWRCRKVQGWFWDSNSKHRRNVFTRPRLRWNGPSGKP